MHLSRNAMIAALFVAVVLAGCTMTWPVAVIGQKGEILRSTATASLGSGSFSVTNGKLTCGGGYDSLDTSATITIPVTCSDGRRGVAIVTRDRSGQSGGGTVRMTDGEEATLIFGQAAAGF